MANVINGERLIDGVGVGIRVTDINYPEDILLIKRYDGTWGLPGGKVQYGESVYEAAARELEEETGLKIYECSMLSDALEFVGAAESFYGRGDEYPRHFLSMIFQVDKIYLEGDLKVDGEEILDIKWCKIWELPSPIFIPTQQALKLIFQSNDSPPLSEFSEDMYRLRIETRVKMNGNPEKKAGPSLRLVKNDGEDRGEEE